MLARFERYLYALIAMLALWAVVVAVTPATAQAQQTAPTKDTKDTNRNTAESIVVSPGDSLWSITSEHLGPNATPRQVAIGVERIYALNQDRIGDDPDLIFPGQKLLLPAVSEPSRTEASGAAPPARQATKPAEASTRDPGGPEETTKVRRSTETKPVALPDMPTKQPAPRVGSPSATDAPSPIESFVRSVRSLFSSATSAVVGLFAQDDRFGGRRLLGLGIIALTLLVAGLIAWKMPLKRNVGGLEAGGIPRGYAGGYIYPTEATDHYGGTPRLVPTSPVSEPDSRSIEGGEAPAVENGPNAAGMIVAALRRRRQVLREQDRGSRQSSHTGLATGVHNPQVRRHLRRARTSAPELALARGSRFRRRSLSPKGGRL